MDPITLTNESIMGLQPDNLVAITIAEMGAMGDPGAIKFVDKKLKVYYTHFGEINDDLLGEAIPFLPKISLMLGEVKGLPEDWDYLYTGYGNYLFIRPGLKDGISEYIRANYKDTKMPEIVELYSHWYEALKNVFEDKK